MAVARLAAALTRGAVRSVMPKVGPHRVVPAPPTMGRSVVPGEQLARVREPVIPPSVERLPTLTHTMTDSGGRFHGVLQGSPIGFSTAGGRRTAGGIYRPAEDIAAARAAAGPVYGGPSMGSRPHDANVIAIKEAAQASGLMPQVTRREISQMISNPPPGGLTSYELSIIGPLIASNRVEFTNAIKRIRLLRLDPKITPTQRAHIEETVVDVARNRFGINNADELLSLMGEQAAKVAPQTIKLANTTVNRYMKDAVNTDDMMNIYNFVIRQNLLDDPKFRTRFLIDFEKAMSRVARGELRRAIGTGNPADDEIAALAWSQISNGGLRSGEYLRSLKQPKVSDYANALRTSYTKRELDEVGAMLREAAPALKQADSDMLLGLYAKQQDLVFKNAFNRIQSWLKNEQGERMQTMAMEIRRLGELPPGKRIEYPQPLRSKAGGVRKATDPSSSPIEKPATGYSWREGEGTMGISQLRAEALNTADLHASYVTRAFLNSKGGAPSSTYIRTSKQPRPPGYDPNVNADFFVQPVTYREAGLSQPYIVGKVHDGINVRMIGARPKPGKGAKTAEDFAGKIASSDPGQKITVTSVNKLSADNKVDKVFLENLIDDLTLMTKPDSDFVLRHTTGPKQGEVIRTLARAPLTRASEGLPNNLTRDQAREFVKTLDLRELQRAEMQHWVDKRGYQMIHDIHYARTMMELDAIAGRLSAAYVSGMVPEGFYQIVRQTLSSRAALIPSGMGRFAAPGQAIAKGSKLKRYQMPGVRFDPTEPFSTPFVTGRPVRAPGRDAIQHQRRSRSGEMF